MNCDIFKHRTGSNDDGRVGDRLGVKSPKAITVARSNARAMVATKNTIWCLFIWKTKKNKRFGGVNKSIKVETFNTNTPNQKTQLYGTCFFSLSNE